MTREEQILNGFTEMMKGLWNNQDLKVPDIETLESRIPLKKTACECEKYANKWIPINEKLPDLDDYTSSKVWQKKVLITGYLSFDDTKETFVSEAFVKDVICNTVHNTIVIAWMPLPEPYKAESED